ncbi:MAG: hypothetical protein QOG72_1883 [Sphingomonadales bacterium]|jgi:hypothetical protein|nr:hypothetical protein [Sphingomonadales bacterium]
MSGRTPHGPGPRFGAAEIVAGGARVAVRSEPPPAADLADSAPSISEAEASKAGLFRPRLIEFGETCRETAVAARPFVREELVVGRTVGRRVERIEETVRRTEVEVEDLPPRAGEDKS